MNINDLETQYIRTNDGLIGVIDHETKTEIRVHIEGWNGLTRFRKDTLRQRGTPSRSFRYVSSLSDI